MATVQNSSFELGFSTSILHGIQHTITAWATSKIYNVKIASLSLVSTAYTVQINNHVLDGDIGYGFTATNIVDGSSLRLQSPWDDVNRDNGTYNWTIRGESTDGTSLTLDHYEVVNNDPKTNNPINNSKLSVNINSGGYSQGPFDHAYYRNQIEIFAQTTLYLANVIFYNMLNKITQKYFFVGSEIPRRDSTTGNCSATKMFNSSDIPCGIYNAVCEFSLPSSNIKSATSEVTIVNSNIFRIAKNIPVLQVSSPGNYTETQLGGKISATTSVDKFALSGMGANPRIRYTVRTTYPSPMQFSSPDIFPEHTDSPTFKWFFTPYENNRNYISAELQTDAFVEFGLNPIKSTESTFLAIATTSTSIILSVTSASPYTQVSATPMPVIQIIGGSQVTLSAQMSGFNTNPFVLFTLDERQNIGYADAPPYAISWHAPLGLSGLHTIIATAENTSGQMSKHTVDINIVKPEIGIQILGLKHGEIVNQLSTNIQTKIALLVEGNDKIDRIKFKFTNAQGADYLPNDNATPGVNIFPVSFLPLGEYTITATAYGSRTVFSGDEVTVSDSVKVIFKGNVPRPPGFSGEVITQGVMGVIG